MYKKLEEDDRTVKQEEETPAGECGCPCAEPKIDGETAGPEAKYSVVYLPVYYDING